jgi:hypothetical protein
LIDQILTTGFHRQITGFVRDQQENATISRDVRLALATAWTVRLLPSPF